MAIWTLDFSPTFTTVNEELIPGYTPFDTDGVTYYFMSGENGGINNSGRVYSWDGVTTFADISGTSFTGADDYPFGILVFGGEVYVFVDHDLIPSSTVHKWTGTGQVWTLQNTQTHTLRNVGGSPRCARDTNRMVAGAASTFQPAIESSDGTTWNDVVVDSGEGTINQSFGLNHRSTYANGITAASGNFTRQLERVSGVWTRIAGGPTDNFGQGFLGFSNQYNLSFFAPLSVTNSSVDWGQTLVQVEASFLSPRVWDMGTGFLMSQRSTTNETFKFNGTNFISNGTCGGATNDVHGYLDIGTTLYAVVQTSAAGGFELYTSDEALPGASAYSFSEGGIPGATIIGPG